jgi:hypothetical protein
MTSTSDDSGIGLCGPTESQSELKKAQGSELTHEWASDTNLPWTILRPISHQIIKEHNQRHRGDLTSDLQLPASSQTYTQKHPFYTASDELLSIVGQGCKRRPKECDELTNETSSNESSRAPSPWQNAAHALSNEQRDISNHLHRSLEWVLHSTRGKDDDSEPSVKVDLAVYADATQRDEVETGVQPGAASSLAPLVAENTDSLPSGVSTNTTTGVVEVDEMIHIAR